MTTETVQRVQNRSAVDQILAEQPLLHNWNGEWKSGGFQLDHLRLIIDSISKFGERSDLRIIETGAGLSTVLFVAIGAREVVSITPDGKLRARILNYLKQNNISKKSLRIFEDLSEEILPKIASRRKCHFDVGLIDGGHGWPTVFVDFCYINKALRQGGILFIDDIQLHSVHELYNLLADQPGFELIDKKNKLVVFKKTSERSYLPDFGGQPYIKKQKLYSFDD